MAAPALAVKKWSDCDGAYAFPAGFGAAKFGMSAQEVQGLSRCGISMLGEEDGVYSAAGKIDNQDVIYDFTVTPKAKKLFKVSMEMLNQDLFDDIRAEVSRQIGAPTKDDKGRDVWVDANSGAVLRMYRHKAYYKIRVQNPSFLLEEAMGYYCDKTNKMPAGIGPFVFGANIEDTVKVMGCGYRFVAKANSQVTLEGYAFNQPADVYLTFVDDRLASVDYVIKKLDAAPLIMSVITDQFGNAGGSGNTTTWDANGGTVTMDYGKVIRVTYRP